MGIGASAGGLTALKDFFGRIPEDTGLAFVVIVHLSPDRESHLTEILQPHCTIPVQQVTETVALKPNRIFIIPPNANLNTIDTHLRLSKLEEKRRERAPIDHFLRTLAETHGDQAVGLILTGTGSDGTLGLRQIKEHGGLTIAQDPAEAEFDGMPRSAIASGAVDLTLTLEKMPEHILRFARTSPKVPEATPEQVEPEDAERVIQKILTRTRSVSGRDFSHYKRPTIMRRIRRRMQLNQVEELGRYLQTLRNSREEVRSLADDLLITVTEFFRDPETFELLKKKVIPRLFEGKTPEDQVRVWTVGCSTGEEAYSLAMLLMEEAGRRENPPQIQVFASDLHESALKKAREGVYPESIRTGISEDRLRRFFTREDSSFRIRKHVRELIIFAPHNLLRDPPFAHLDLITCRNLLIYLQRDAQREAATIFHYALNKGGYLLLGSSETLERSELFVSENKEHCLYHRRDVPTRELHLALNVPGFERNESKEPPARPGELRPGFGSVHEKMVERYAPPSILVNDRHEVVHYSAHAGRYLHLPGGDPTQNIFKLVKGPLRIELRAALHAARQSGAAFRSKPILMRIEAEPKQVVVRVRALEENDLQGFFLVIFDEIETEPETESPSGENKADATVKELEAELEMTKKRLQTAIEEYETGQDDTQAMLEELQSTNEELRSTMEELETSKEELQSMNEELSTMNQENRHRIEELSQLTADLQNLMAAADIPTLFLDRNLRILRFTPQASDLFNILHTDRGRPLTDLTHRLGDNRLQKDARQVLDRLVPVERELQSEESRWYLTRVLPYRTEEDRIEGVVITLIDITDRKGAETALRRLNETLEQRVRDRTRLAEARSRQLQTLAVELIEAEERERRRIAHLLHDDLQQDLASIRMQLQTVCRDLEDMPMLERIDRLLSKSIQKSRQVSHELCPPVLHHSSLIDAMKWLIRQMETQFGLSVRLKVEASPSVENGPLKAFLFRAVQELLFNIHKHAGEKNADLLISGADDRLVISVRDYGRGFDPDSLESGDARTGLGLPSLRERVRFIGGDLVVESEPGKGARFTISVPIDLSQAREADIFPSVADRPSETPVKIEDFSNSDRIRVVFVDDHKVMRKGLIRILADQPAVEVAGEAENGQDALALIRQVHPDVVVMDINMPGMDGIEATRRIKSEMPHIRVIGLSMFQDEEIVRNLKQAGAEAFINKTAGTGELLQAIYGTDGPEVK